MKTVSIFLIGLLGSWLLMADEIHYPVVTQQRLIHDNFNQPTAIANSDDGRFFVLDGMNSRIVLFSKTAQRLSTITPNKQIPNFSRAVGLSWHNGNLYIADTQHHRILVLTETGVLIQKISLPITPPERYQPDPVAVHVIDQTLFYTDRRHHRLCLIQLDQSNQQQCIGKRGEQPGEFQFPFQIAVDKDDYLHVVDVINGRVQIFNSRGVFFSEQGKFSVDELYRPNGIAIDALGYHYVSDAYLGTIAIFKQERYLGQLKDSRGQLIKFSTPVGLGYDTVNGLYVVDAATDTIHQLQLGYQFAEQNVLNTTQQATELSRKNCVACHFSWGFNDPKNLQDQQGVNPVASLAMCYSCHHGVVFESRQAIPHGGQHPTVYDKAAKKQKRQKKLPRKNDIPTGHPLLNNGEMLCTTCHTPHNPENEQPTLYVENTNAWMRLPNKDSKLCENCHESNSKQARQRNKKLRGINHPLGFKLSKPSKNSRSKNYSKDPHLQKGLPKRLRQAGGVLGSDQQMVCQSCHQIHGGEGNNLLTLNDNQGKLCAECHQRQSPKGKKGARKAGVHPVNVKLEKPVTFRGKKTQRVSCDSCHSVHDGTQGTPLFPDKIKQTEKLCVACHQRQHAKDKKEALKKGIHPVNETLEKTIKIADQQVKKIGCLSCHSIHNGQPNTPALIENHTNGQLCENCHENKQRVVGTDHDFRITAKKTKNQFKELPHQSGACGSCHTMHRGKGKQPFLYAATLADKKQRDESAPTLAVDELCLNCHQEKGMAKDKQIKHYGHPYKDIIMQSKIDVMPLLDKNSEKIKKIGVIACITCHEPHSWKPIENKADGLLPFNQQKNQEGNVLNSFLRRKGVIKTFCVDCHSIEALSKYKYFHHENKVRGIGVDYLH